MLYRQTEGAGLESSILFSSYGSKMALSELHKKNGSDRTTRECRVQGGYKLILVLGHNIFVLKRLSAENSGGSRGGKGGASVPPFGLHLTLRSTDNKLNGTPLSGYRTKKTTAMAHLRML